MEKIILICGKPGSGKGTLSRFIEDRYGALVYHFSEPLHKILSDFSIPNTRENLAKISFSLRKNFGEHILGLGAGEYIEKNKGKMIILEGIRRAESLMDWKDKVDHIIWIDAKPEIRYSRMLSRGEKSSEDILLYEEFCKQESGETELTLENLRDMADIVIENNGSREDFYENFDTFLLSK